MMSEEIRRADRKIFFREFLLPRRIVLQLLNTGLLIAFFQAPLIAFWLVGFVAHIGFAESAARKKRFLSARFADLWSGCRDRYEDFETSLAKLRKADIAYFEDLPKRILEMSLTLYQALRRADILWHEIQISEGKERFQPGTPSFATNDPQSQALYQMAERSLGDYRDSYNELIAGIQRTEAQATVYIHTLDVLRVKMHSYRLLGKNPSLDSQDFLSIIAETRLTLESIDTALEELDLSHYPQLISVVHRDPKRQGSIPSDLGSSSTPTEPNLNFDMTAPRFPSEIKSEEDLEQG